MFRASGSQHRMGNCPAGAVKAEAHSSPPANQRRRLRRGGRAITWGCERWLKDGLDHREISICRDGFRPTGRGCRLVRFGRRLTSPLVCNGGRFVPYHGNKAADRPGSCGAATAIALYVHCGRRAERQIAGFAKAGRRSPSRERRTDGDAIATSGAVPDPRARQEAGGGLDPDSPP